MKNNRPEKAVELITEPYRRVFWYGGWLFEFVKLENGYWRYTEYMGLWTDYFFAVTGETYQGYDWVLDIKASKRYYNSLRKTFVLPRILQRFTFDEGKIRWNYLQEQKAPFELFLDEQSILDQKLVDNLNGLGESAAWIQIELDCDYQGDFSLLTEIRQLRSLKLDWQNLSENDCRILGRLSSLESLRLNRCRFSNRDFATALQNLSRLTVLDLSKTEANDCVAAAVASLPLLKELDLSITRIRRKGINAIRSLIGLHSLNLAGLEIIDADIEYWSANKNLICLNVAGASITDGALRTLEDASRLRELVLSEVDDSRSNSPRTIFCRQITRQGLDRFRFEKPDCNVFLEKPAIWKKLIPFILPVVFLIIVIILVARY